MDKEGIRRKILAIRQKQQVSLKTQKDKKIIAKIEKMLLFRRAKEFFTYLSHRGEVSTDELIKKYFNKKKVVAPCVREGEIIVHDLLDHSKFKKGKFGIREPHIFSPRKELKNIDIALVPAIAFDGTGHRIGFGHGYFDRFLKRLKKANGDCVTIGLAYEFQIIDKIKTHKYDVAVDCIVTEKRIIKPIF